MAHQITLRFEDGVTRIIECEENERVTDAALRAKIDIPLDCRDGVCGTCKAVCRSGKYELGDCVEDALSAQEADAGQVLTCQMSPRSDCIVEIATASGAAAGAANYTGKIGQVRRVSSTAIAFSITLEDREDLIFLPGQYVNIAVPGTDQTRSYSFSSGPGESEVSFLVRNVPQGLMSTYLCD